MATGKYLSKQKTAVYLDVCEKTIDRLRARGDLTSIPVGTRVRITIASLEAYEQRQAQLARKGTAEPFAIPTLDALRTEKAARRSGKGAAEEQAA